MLRKMIYKIKSFDKALEENKLLMGGFYVYETIMFIAIVYGMIVTAYTYYCLAVAIIGTILCVMALPIMIWVEKERTNEIYKQYLKRKH